MSLNFLLFLLGALFGALLLAVCVAVLFHFLGRLLVPLWGVQAECGCGWRGPWRHTMGGARMDSLAHAAQEHRDSGWREILP